MMKNYIQFEIKKLMCQSNLLFILIISVLITAFYQYHFFTIINEQFAIIHHNNSKVSFDYYFFTSLSSRIHFILVMGCAIATTIIWELENRNTIQQVSKLTPGSITHFMGAKLLLGFFFLTLQMFIILIVILFNMKSFVPIYRNNLKFDINQLSYHLFLQYLWLIPIIMINTYWYILLGERAWVVFIFSVAGVYLLGFISFTPYYTFFHQTYLNTNELTFTSIFYLTTYILLAFFFLRKQLLLYF